MVIQSITELLKGILKAIRIKRKDDFCNWTWANRFAHPTKLVAAQKLIILHCPEKNVTALMPLVSAKYASKIFLIKIHHCVNI